MELDDKKIMPVSELKRALALEDRKSFVLAIGEILMRALKAYQDDNLSDKFSFLLLLDMADFIIDGRLYNEIKEELREKSWLEQKILNFLQKRGIYTETSLDLNQLISVGTTHYYQKNWGNSCNFRDDLQWFASELR